MIDDTNKSDCRNYRTSFENRECGQVLSPGEILSMDKHAASCIGCSSFSKQHAEIANLSMSLPLFDVSEGLTQKILDSVEKQSTPGIETSLLPVGIAASVAFVLMVPFDSLQSLYGWGIGILGLMALQLLIKTANTKEQVV